MTGNPVATIRANAYATGSTLTETVTWSKNREGVYLQASENFATFFSLAFGENPLGRKDSQVFPAEIAKNYEKGDREVMLSRRPLIIEEPYPGGWLETIKTPLYGEDGQLIGTSGLARDITERRRKILEMEKKECDYRSLAENSPDIILRFNRQICLVYANPAALRFAGLSFAQARDQTPEQHGVLGPRDAILFSSGINSIFTSRQAIEQEFRWNKDGTNRCLVLRLVPEFDLDGSVASVLVVGRDSSTLVEAQERLRKSQEILRKLALHRLKELEAERRKVTYRIHEDLAQDLSALRLHLLLLKRNQSDKAETPVLQMSEITDRCISRIRDLVVSLRPSVVDLGIVPALQWLANDFRRGLQLEISLNLPDHVDLSEETTLFLFRSAQEALLNTALHGAATQVLIRLHCEERFLRLCVEDNGCGFRPDVEPPEGAFGLLGMSEHARALGGFLEIDSFPGQGTRLELKLPAPGLVGTGELFTSSL